MTDQVFDASRHLTQVDGRAYLEVKWRLLWLRTEHPDALLRTELVEHRDGFALFKATALLPSGGEATGWGSETVDEFQDYLEAAETKALGRALAALGYGTQFCQDFSSCPAEPEPVADAPVVGTPENTERKRLKSVTATEAQVNAIHAIARQVYSWDEASLEEHCREVFGRTSQELTKRQASQFIDDLKAKRLTA